MAGTVAERAIVEQRKMATMLAGIAAGGGTVTFVAGEIQIDNDGVTVLASANGNVVTATWNAGIIPYDGASILLALVTKDNSSQYFVLCVTDQAPNPGYTGKVTAFTAGQPTVTVTGGDGVSYVAQRAATYTPAVGDTCVLLVQGSQVFAICALATYTPAPKPSAAYTPPPPPKKSTGVSKIACQDSGTWTSAYGGWNSYYGRNVYSGSGYVPPSTGAWFYNGGTKGLADKTTISRIQFYLGPRQNAGAYNSTATVHFYAHNAVYRGGSEPSRIVGPFDVNVGAHFSGGWIDLPLSFAATLKAGGGVSIAGDPYVGFAATAGSGALYVNWSK